jgi:DNA-binding CsgD family transcriptional regulator
MGDITAAPDVDEVVERAISLRRPIPPYNSPVTRKAWLQVARGETSAGRPAIETGYAQAASAGDELQRRWMLVPMTELEWRSGNYEQARVYAQEGVEFAEQLESRHSLSMFHQLRALVDAYRGDVESARASAELALACAHDVGSPFFAARAEIVLGHIELATDDYAAAAGRLGAVDDRLRAGGLVVSGRHFFCYEPDLVEALSGAGRVERTLELGALLAGQRYPVYRATAERARGLAAAARGDNSEALAALRSSLALWETLQVPFERARSLLLLGEAQRRAKARGEARATLLQAQTIFDSIGALRWSERTRAEIARLGGRTRSDAELTPAELRVAQLAGAGKTNKEIAAALFVTVGTVEAALTRVYRKLDVRSRTELARKL